MERRTTGNSETMYWMNKNEIIAGGLLRVAALWMKGEREKAEPEVPDALDAFGRNALAALASTFSRFAIASSPVYPHLSLCVHVYGVYRKSSFFRRKRELV